VYAAEKPVCILKISLFYKIMLYICMYDTGAGLMYVHI
jgi:hypothetical protein